MTQEAFGRRPHEPTFKAPPAMRSHGDQVRLIVADHSLDFGSDMTERHFILDGNTFGLHFRRYLLESAFELLFHRPAGTDDIPQIWVCVRNDRRHDMKQLELC